MNESGRVIGNEVSEKGVDHLVLIPHETETVGGF